MICYNYRVNKRKYPIWPLDVASSPISHNSYSCTYLQIVWCCTKSTLHAINTSICNVLPWKWVLSYHLTTIVNFDNFTFCSTVLSNDVIETSNWFYFLSNALYYIQIKFRDHKLSTTVENIHPKVKKIYKILHFIVLIMTTSKNKPKRFFMNQEYKFSSFV